MSHKLKQCLPKSENILSFENLQNFKRGQMEARRSEIRTQYLVICLKI